MATEHTLIIGGSSGIGLATARRLLAAGHRVTIAGRDAARLEAAQRDLDGVATQVLDAADLARPPETLAGIGPVDHLVLALGSRRGGGPFASVSVADVREGLEEKVIPQFAVAQAALPHLAVAGSITFVAAVSAHGAMPGTAGLGAQNAAVVGLVPILASELRPRRVNGVSPGVVDTPWWDFLDAAQRAEAFAGYAAQTPVGRVGQPDDIAQAIAFLIGNGFMTGHTIICDGGIRLAG